MAGQIKRIHDLDEITTLNNEDVLVVDVALAGGVLLLEDGDNLLLESGDNLRLEESAGRFKTYKITFANLLSEIQAATP